MNKNEILRHLREQQHWIAQRHHEEWLGIFHFGSHNYGLSDQYSDVDARYITFSNEKIKEYSYKEEHIEVVSFDTFVWGLTNGQLTFLETLSTEYFFVNPKFIKEWLELKKYLTVLIEHSRARIGSSLVFCASQSIEKFEKNITEDPLYKIKGYPPKTLSHLKRYNLYADRLLSEEFENFFFVPDKQEHLFLKRVGTSTREEAYSIVMQDFALLKQKVELIPPDKKDFPRQLYWAITAFYVEENSNE